ncbi:hypothetical protein [Streptomyces sp. NPDC048196]
MAGALELLQGARALMAACRKLGAREALGPGNAGHSTHGHCGWSR